MILRRIDGFLIFVFAFLVRLVSIFFAGGFDSVLGYDDGVYYSASTAFNHGLIPYRDFVLVHPPGILFVLTPFTWISELTTDQIGFYLARIFFMVIGALSAWMIYRIGSRWSRGAGVAAALFYAVWMPVVRIERTAYLEGLGILFTLIALHILLEGKQVRRDALTMGLLMGAATSMKIWYAVPIVVSLLWLAVNRELKKAIIIGVTSLTTFFVVCSYFIVKAGRRFFELVLYAQTQRAGEPIFIAERLEKIFNTQSVNWINSRNISLISLLIILTLVTKYIIDNITDRKSQLVLLLFIFQLAVLLRTPVFFNAYPSFIAISLALIFGTVIARLPSKILVAAIMIVVIPIGLHSAFTQEPGRDLPNKIERLPFASSRCVTSDSPAVLILTNTLTRNLHNKCHLIFDVSGDIYGIDGGANRLHENSTDRQLHSRQYQREVESYLAQGGVIILARRTIDGLTTESWQKLLAGRKVSHSHSFYIISK